MMDSYKIEIQETLSRVVEIVATSAEEAIDKVREIYRDEEIVLDSDDYVETNIKELKD